MKIGSKKLPESILLRGGFGVVIILAVVFIFLSFVLKKPAENIPAPIPQDKVIFRPTQKFGLTGVIVSVGPTDNSFIWETAALPYDGVRPQKGATWKWKVIVEDDTEIILLIPNNEAEDEDPEESHFYKEPAAFTDIAAGDGVSITSKNDLLIQFSLAEKEIRAQKIQIKKPHPVIE